jgi:hypothetical protein
MDDFAPIAKTWCRLLRSGALPAIGKTNGSRMASMTENGNGLDWRLDGPGADGRVRLDRADLGDLDLGPADAVRARLSAFCRGAAGRSAMEADTAPLAWELEGPDTGGVVTLLWNGPEPEIVRLGHIEPVCAGFRTWLDAFDA